MQKEKEGGIEEADAGRIREGWQLSRGFSLFVSPESALNTDTYIALNSPSM